MQSDSQDNQEAAGGFAGSAPDAAGAAAAHSPPISRRLAWVVAACAIVAIAAATVWAVRAWQTEKALADVTSVAGSLGMTPKAPAPAGDQARPNTAAPGITAAPGVSGPAEPAAATATAAANDRLPPLVLPGQPVPQAVLRDLPEWVASELGPVQTSGASGDETAAPTAASQPPAAPQRQRAASPPRADRYGAVFARCPGPGESGAVECRRAVCDGAARKSAACAPYIK